MDGRRKSEEKEHVFLPFYFYIKSAVDVWVISGIGKDKIQNSRHTCYQSRCLILLWNWPLNNLCRESKKEKKRRNNRCISICTAGELDGERTNGSITNSPFLFLSVYPSLHSCLIFLIGKEGERWRVIDAESPLQQHSTHKFFLFIFFLTPYSTTASRSFCSSSTELRVLRFFSLHYNSSVFAYKSGYEGIEEHERSPAYFGFFDTLNCMMNFTY